MILDQSTIVAISSAVGPAARMIVRLSGERAHEIARSMCDELPGAGQACSTRLRFNGLVVPVEIYLFANPHSYTGEDLVEFHIPGNPLLARMLLDALVTAGARQAEPGEFTARAYFNGCMDLSSAEGVAATIAAHSESELRAARQLMAGELAKRLRPAIDELTETLALLEAGIDFSDEDISFISTDALRDRVARIDSQLQALIAECTRFERLTHEPTFVLVGKPNAGKSTLLNALAGHERAVVSPIAGTTRDVLSAEVALTRGVVRVMDVAGIQSHSPAEGIERDMIDRAIRAAESADFIILVSDTAPATWPTATDLVVHTKSDLSLKPPLAVSAVTGEGLGDLRRAMDQLAFGHAPAGASLALNARHLQCITEARAALDRLLTAQDPEIIALDLRESLDALGRVLGQVTPDDVLGRIFSTFCIGK